jgi:hypothetical protein
VRMPTFSVEVITLPVSDVERTLRFYVDQVGLTLDVDYSPNEAVPCRAAHSSGSSCSIVGWKLARSGTRRPLEPGTEVAGLDPRAETMPASPTSPLATAGCYRNGATAMYDLVWKLGDVDQARRRINSQEEIEADTRSSVLSSRAAIFNLHHSR